MRGHSVTVVGATGLVGTTLLSLFAERGFPIKELFLIASQKSKGKKVEFKGNTYVVQDLESFDFKKSQITFFCVSSKISAQFAPIAAAAGNIVIDDSFQFRNHTDVPLIVPEVNISSLANFRKMNIIANPNCSVIPIAVALKPIYDAVGISRINVSTYQAVSGTGKEAVVELREQSERSLSNQQIHPKVYSQQIAFNVLPHCDDFQDNGYTREEMKIVWEMRKIFSDTSLAVNPTAVRVPVFCGHAASVHIETKDKITKEHALQLLSNAPGVQLITGEYPYATPVSDAAGNDHVYIGRVREDISHDKGLNLWIVADNLRKGAALNVIQIAEHLIENYL